jgi:hypothetical protein
MENSVPWTWLLSYGKFCFRGLGCHPGESFCSMYLVVVPCRNLFLFVTIDLIVVLWMHICIYVFFFAIDLIVVLWKFPFPWTWLLPSGGVLASWTWLSSYDRFSVPWTWLSSYGKIFVPWT